jgi:hypothetical protein
MLKKGKTHFAVNRGMPHLYLSKLFIAGHCWEIRVEPESWTVKRNDELVAQGRTEAARVNFAFMGFF